MEHVSSIQIKTNYVLIRPEKDIEQLKSGLYIQPSQEDKSRGIANTEARHYNITGEVLVVPDNLIYRGSKARAHRNKTGGIYDDYQLKDLQSIIRGSMHHETKMELEVGDKVWFDYLAHINANTESKTITVDGYGECILVEYSQLFIRERDGGKIPLNGYIFIEKVSHNRALIDGLDGMIEIPDTVEMGRTNKAVVRVIGTPVNDYLSEKYTDRHFSDIKPGQTIYYNEGLATPLEYEIHATSGLEQLFKIRRSDIHAIITEDEMVFDSKVDTRFRIPLKVAF